ncbi:EF-hand domain-containing protein [Thalassoroseus pseudoceratinae]|uniref:EF-hand domain-containing protein n=1 Tax=Thalassoroseus pseudoceratinae TaxID=2713176 RepID=UPI00141F77E5|nr:EF-hand domain-containing protein [Thalassoroseus pseudoceratinae]
MLRNFSAWAPLFLLALVIDNTSLVFAQRPSGGWIADRMDSNNDGEIDENEASRLPGPFQEALRNERLRFPISKDRFAEIVPRLMEEMRRNGSFGRPPGGGPPGGGRGGDDRRGYGRGDDDGDRGRGYGRGGPPDRGGYDRGGSDRGGYDRGRGDDRNRGGYGRGGWGDRGGSDRGRSSDRRGESSKEKEERPRVTVDLAEAYSEADSDGDGQIALYEWRQWKPAELNQFFLADANRDSFLTPRELEIFEKFPVTETDATTMASNFLASSNAGPSSPNGPASRSTDAPKDKPSAKEAQYVFKVLDRNRDGEITEDEWQRSKGARAGFEEAGIKVPLPARIDTFLAVYPYERLFPQMTIR